MQFIDSARFMASSLSNLVNNCSKGIHKIKYKYGHNNKKCETCGIIYKVCNCFLEYTNFKDDLTEYKYKQNTRFLNTYKYSNHDNNKFILLLRKAVYFYEYMGDWKKFNETSLPEIVDFYRVCIRIL